MNPGTGLARQSNTFVAALALQPDGKLLAGGFFRQFSGVSADHLVRLNTNGTLVDPRGLPCSALWCSIFAVDRRWELSEYQVVSLDAVEDWLGDYPGEMRGITYAMGAEQVAVTYRRMPQHTGSKGSYGPT